MRRIVSRTAVAKIEREARATLTQLRVPRGQMRLVEVQDSGFKHLFDEALDEIHYAGSCSRVGRCMRIAAFSDREWVGGIVLGSTFPNILVRDEALGLRKHVASWKKRGLRSPWSRENTAYWSALQTIVNHARTFIFPRYQAHGLGIAAHRRLLTEGIPIWKRRYPGRVTGIDTLCTHEDSRLFKDNGWQLVGRTKGYSSDPSVMFSKRAFQEDWATIKNNVALRRIRGSTRWFVWVRPL